MTLDTIIRRVNYEGDNRTTCFPFPFKVWGKDQIVVYCFNSESAWTEVDITNRVTVTLNEDNYGGAVVFSNPPASGINFAIVREGSFLQEDEYISGTRFDAHEIEDRFDEDAAERQELLDGLNRAIKVPNSSTQTPEEVYELLIKGAEIINSSLDSLTELYELAVYYYNLALGIFGEETYMRSRETSFFIPETHIIEEEGPWTCMISDGFQYYPKTNQLLVTIDGLALTPDIHFEEVGNYGETSNEILFLINVYKGQQVYIKASFLGTEEFDVKLQTMNNRIAEATENLQNIVKEAKDYTENIRAELTSLYEEASFFYNEAINLFGEGGYVRSNEVSFLIPGTHIIEEEGSWTCTIPNGFQYYPKTNQLLVTIDGLALTPDTHFSEVGNYGETSNEILFLINVYKGQQVYIKASFLGTEAFNIKLNEMDEKIQEASEELQNLVSSTTTNFTNKTDELESLIQETKNDFEETTKTLTESIERTEALVSEATELLGSTGGLEGFQKAIEELSNLYSTFNLNSLPTQGFCSLSSDYGHSSCLDLPSGVCYFKDTNTLHVAIDGIVLSPEYFEEIGGETGANYIKLHNICLLSGQELHAWTDLFLDQGDWEPAAFQSDITTRLYVTSSSNCIYYSDDLGRNWSLDTTSSADSNTINDTSCCKLFLSDHGLYLTIGENERNVCWSWDKQNWISGCGLRENNQLNNLWANIHIPFFTNEPVTKLEAMWPAPEEDEGGDNEPEEPEEGEGPSGGEGGEGGDSDENGDTGNSEDEGSEDQEEESDNPAEESPAAFKQSLPASEDAASENGHCYLWGPISYTYQLKSDLSFESNSIPVHIIIDRDLPSETGNGHGNGATVVIYCSDIYQRLTRDNILSEIEGISSQTWHKFACYEVCGPVEANTELYTCFSSNAAGLSSGEFSPSSAGYPTCWPAGYYAAAIYNVYGGCSLQKSIPKINFYISQTLEDSVLNSADGEKGEENNDSQG